MTPALAIDHVSLANISAHDACLSTSFSFLWQTNDIIVCYRCFHSSSGCVRRWCFMFMAPIQSLSCVALIAVLTYPDGKSMPPFLLVLMLLVLLLLFILLVCFCIRVRRGRVLSSDQQEVRHQNDRHFSLSSPGTHFSTEFMLFVSYSSQSVKYLRYLEDDNVTFWTQKQISVPKLSDIPLR